METTIDSTNIIVGGTRGGILADANLLKVQLATGTRLSQAEVAKKALATVADEKAARADRAIAIESLARVKAPEAEDALVRIATKNEPALSYSGYKALASMGTDKAFRALSAVKATGNASLDRQKDFAMLVMGYKNNLSETDAILARLQKDTTGAPKRSDEFILKFQALKPEEVTPVVKQADGMNYGVTLSKNVGFEVNAGGQRFYFCFSSKFEEPAKWEEVLKSKQVIGQLFRKEKHGNSLSSAALALATPGKDGVQVTFFKSNGEVFMQANAVYDKEKRTLSITNVKDDKPKNAEKREFKIDAKSAISMNLAYIRHAGKRSGDVDK